MLFHLINNMQKPTPISFALLRRTVLLFSFVSNVVNYNVSSTSLVKLVVDGIAAPKIDNLLAIKQSVLVLN